MRGTGSPTNRPSKKSGGCFAQVGGWVSCGTPRPRGALGVRVGRFRPDRKGLDDSDDANKGLPFPPTETQTATFPVTREMTPDYLRSYLATHSAVAAMKVTEREELLDVSQAIVARVCERSGRATAPLRHEAFCVRWQPR